MARVNFGRVMGRLGLGLGMASAAFAGAAAPSPLDGCWRSQQVTMTMADGRQRHLNGDCVAEYGGGQSRSRCWAENGFTESVFAVEPVGPGQTRVTPLDAATAQPKGPAGLSRWRIDDRWLMVERDLALPGAAGAAASGASSATGASGATGAAAQVVGFRAVSMRVALAPGERCAPRGDTGLRVGRSPRSSLALPQVPAGWQPWLVDPGTDPRVGAGVGSSLFLGAFVPTSVRTLGADPSPLILVLDDTRPGPVALHGEGFATVRQQFTQGFDPADRLCEEPDRACVLMHPAEGGLAYSEMVNLAGRAVIVTGISSSVGVPLARTRERLVPAVQAFVAALRQGNAR